ncbi:SAC3/GANP/Nin1/mts3/eIF-3 p25 family protein [Cryptosporidium meleagridis]|uniref:SAC3/GANP/Nin1/mts3/eIF-3 p25 family protein n=1 Tax=Cryptosporidium meleagridis TaxID=93969 RepID=A0A2P4Z2F4_9CRYT|nr:SAC3/GANP/Nin1/mts3/eIF-3 p25 family protein [Cryptosporidium meleagridis]
MADSFGGKNKAGREIIYNVRDELKPPIENAYSNYHPLLRKEIFEDQRSELARLYFRIQDPIQLSSSGQIEGGQNVFVGELFGMCTREEMINKQQTSTANDFERLYGVTLNDDLEARIVNEFLTVKSFQRSDASRVFHKELVRPVVWCRMVVRRLLVYFIEADRIFLNYLYRKPQGQGYKYIDIYNFLRDRLRAVWQDLTVQHATRHRASIDTFEVSFRFLLFSEEYLCNLKEFNSVQNGSLMSTCLDKLMSGYLDVLYYRKKSSSNLCDSELSRILVYDSPFQPEFWSYRILTSMSIKIKDANDNRIMDIINLISPEMIEHPLIKLSLGIHCSFRFVNIVRYFRYFRKCFGIISNLIKDDNNSVKPFPNKDDQDPEQYRQFGHALILFCILIKKYSNIIRLKYLNILLSSNMSKRQLMPLNSFIEIFGFYIESVESLKLFTERFDIKIFDKDNPNVFLSQGNIGKFQSIQQICNLTTKFVVSFKDCINLSTMESLSILNSLNWPSEILTSLLEKIPRIDILDPIIGKISKVDLINKTHIEDLNKNKISDSNSNQFSFTSLSSSNRDIINSNYKNNSLSNTLIQNLKEIDINKATSYRNYVTNSTKQNKRKGFFMEEDVPFTFSNPNITCDVHTDSAFNMNTNNSNKRRSITENATLLSENTINTPLNLQTQNKLANFQIDPPKLLSQTASSQDLLNNLVPSGRQEPKPGICAPTCHKLPEIKEERKQGEKDSVYNCKKEALNAGEFVQEGDLDLSAQKNGQVLELGKEISVSNVGKNDFENTESNIFGLENQIIEDGLVGLSGWKCFRVFFNKYQGSEIELKEEIENDRILEDDKESQKHINILLSRINLPENENGINQWLNSSVSGILEQVKTDIISRVIKSLKFSFVFFYNQLVNIKGVSRSHISQLNTFYTKLELILSNLTNGDFLDKKTLETNNQLKTKVNHDFIFPWNSVMVKSEILSGSKQENDQMIIDIYEIDFSHENFERFQGNKQSKIPVHVEMLSIWQNNTRTCLRSQLFSNDDFSLFKEKERENLKESENFTLERLLYEYLINNGDVIIWTLPFLVRSCESSINIPLNSSFYDPEDTSNEYLRRSLDSFAFSITSEKGKKHLIAEFESCCKVLNIKRYPIEVKSKIPILKTVTIVLSFVTYIPSHHFILAGGNEAFQQKLKNEILNLENTIEGIILKEYLQESQSLVISDDAILEAQDRQPFNFGNAESALISNYSGVSCNLKFKCIGIAPLEVLTESTFKQDKISIYVPGLNSLINTKLNNKSFPNNLVVSNQYQEDLEINSICFLSTMWLQNFHKGLNIKDSIGHNTKGCNGNIQLSLFKEAIRIGFIDCFKLFTNGNIDWILVSGNCSYTEIKEIIIWIYDLYIHSMACFDNGLLASLTPRVSSLPGGLSWDSKDFCKISDSSGGILKRYERYIKAISDSLNNECKISASSINIPKVIWNVIFDHVKPIHTLNSVLSDSTFFEQFSNLILIEQNLQEDHQELVKNLKREQVLDSMDLLSEMDKELFNYKAFNYFNRFKLGRD